MEKISSDVERGRKNNINKWSTRCDTGVAPDRRNITFTNPHLHINVQMKKKQGQNVKLTTNEGGFISLNHEKFQSSSSNSTGKCKKTLSS